MGAAHAAALAHGDTPASNITAIAERRAASTARDQEDGERRARVQQALRTGERVASADMRDGEYFSMLHQGVLLALAQARRLTGNEHQYILALLAHTHRAQSWAVTDYYTGTVPKLADWSAWLGGMAPQQISRIRESLHTWGILTYAGENAETRAGGDPMRVCFVQEWERWSADLFAAHISKGGGRPPRVTSKLASLETADLNSQVDESSTCEFRDPALASLDEAPATLTSKFRGTSRQPRLQAGSRRVAKNLILEEEDQIKEDSATRRVVDAPQSWPERGVKEPDDSFYSRAVQCCPNRAAAVAYVAHLTLGYPCDAETIRRLTGVIAAIKKTYGRDNGSARWGLIVTAILDVARSKNKPDDDALNVVHKFALAAAARENGKTGSARAAVQRPGRAHIGGDYYQQMRQQPLRRAEREG